MRIISPGGINENDGAIVEECQDGYNFELVYGDTDFRPRQSVDLKGTATNAGSIGGIMQLVQRDGTETTLVYEDNSGTNYIYLWDGASTFTSKRTDNVASGSKLRDVYYSLDDAIVIVDVNLSTPLLNWDGTSCTRHKTALVAGSPTAVGSSLTSSGTTATVDHGSAHGLSTGDLVTMAGATETPYNGEFEITVTGANTFTYTMSQSTTSPATGSPTWDVGVDLYAKYGVIHNGRLWLFNIKTDSTANPHMMVASEFENIQSFDTASRVQDAGFSTGNEAFYMLSKDLKPINGVAVFNNNLIISTEDGRVFRLTGSDSQDYAWVDYYAGSAATGTETMANIGNDVVFMRQGGNIETLLDTDRSGDVETDDLSRWIPTTVKDLTDAITIYDQSNQKVFFFVSNQVLVFYKNCYYGYAGKLSPWSIYKTLLTDSFNTDAARYMLRPGETTRSVYFGDSSGNIYDMNGSGDGDGGTEDIQTLRKLNIMYDLPTEQEVIYGNVQYRRLGECELTLDFDWSDAYNVSNSIMVLKGPPLSETAGYFGGSAYFGGEFYFNEGFKYAIKVSHKNFSPTGRGKSFIMSAYLETKVRFKIDHIELFA